MNTSDYELSLGNPPSGTLLCLGALALAGMAAFSFWAYRSRGRTFWLLPAGLRCLAAGCLGVSIAQPSLKATRTLVSTKRVAVLLDSSESMGLKDLKEGRSRHEQALRLLFGPDERLLASLSDGSEVELFEFDAEPRRLAARSAAEVSPPQGPATRVAAALRQVSSGRAAEPLAAVVLLTDGQDNGVDDVAAAAQLAGVPVFPIGLGDQRMEETRDIALANLQVEKTALVGSTVLAEITVRSRGLSGVAPVTLACAGKEIATALAHLQPGSQETVRLQFAASEVGQFAFTLATPARPEELTAENNRCSFSLEVIDRSIRVVYIEGAMRWEYKFLRRALEQDRDVRLESYLRTGPDRFYYQPSGKAEAGRPAVASSPAGTHAGTLPSPGSAGVPPAGAGTHAGTLPLEASCLTGFDLVIFGDIAARDFSPDQLQAVESYVSEKAGAFLMLGGKSSFAAGGYAGTPIEKLLPVQVSPSGDLQEEGDFRPALTPEGQNHPITRLLPQPEANQAVWAALPALGGSNRTGPAKPGATVLLVRRSARRVQTPDVILAVQRYGRGKAAALAVDTTWRWSFESIGQGSEASDYPQFWSQLIRWLMPDRETDPKVTRPVRVATDKPEYRQAEMVQVEARVVSPEGAFLDTASLDATLTGPDGGAAPISFQKSSEPGAYVATLAPRLRGPHQISVRAASGGKNLGSDACGFLVGEASQELLNTDLNRGLLLAVAQASGGRYFSPEDCSAVPGLIPDIRTETVRTEYTRLWNSPLLLAGFVALATADWLLRRYTGGN
ncbi:MAG: VWA domain-containing protein [Planctomycetes bacterium]|nr:VWA domain-containing protein [Planctomycetota bacterium]